MGTPGSPPTSPVSPLAPYPPLPAPDDRSRAPEFYGFAAWFSTYLLYVLYLLWALLPDAWIRALGVQWYPSREWALLVPAWTAVAGLLTYWTYFALALYGTPAFDDVRAIADGQGLVPVGEEEWAEHAGVDAIPEVYDIPIGLVNRVVYGRTGASG
ncbi:PIG-P-domain-containing protein [Artomyces pyxidatus]|uniref:PIG-P-domain-containing protein n=1 Tax=Artomyces pyxidatus TaxID=48021 RepID=A0ACB8TEP1_9AGAM|nr:PIG-P-domain-containing protein [Artomyces pyxidatus]